MRNLGVGVFVQYRNTFLVGKRGPGCRNGEGCYALPGGMLEDNESIVECAIREVREETGLSIKVVPGQSRQLPCWAVTDHFPNEKHVTFWIPSLAENNEAKPVEPLKCAQWEWITWTQYLQIPGVRDKAHPQYYWMPYEIMLMAMANFVNPFAKDWSGMWKQL